MIGGLVTSTLCTILVLPTFYLHSNVDDVRSAALELPHVSNVHDLHVWTITSAFVARCAQVTCPGDHIDDSLLRDARTLLADRFGVRHATIPIDCDPVREGADRPPFAS